MVPLGRCNAITVHHSGFPDGFTATAVEDVITNLQMIASFHTDVPPKGRGWADIGYHFAVDPAGRVWELRSIQFQGAHVKNHNAANIGVVCLGNFDLHPVPDAQLAALRQLIHDLQKQYGGLRVCGHCELADDATSCPGANLRACLDNLKA